MRVTIPQLNLAALLARGGAVASKKSPMPILQCLRLTAKGGELSVASTDHDRFAEATGGATVDQDGGACVNAQALSAIIAKHPKSGMIGLTIADERLVVTCGRSKVKLRADAVDQFPAWADEAPLSSFLLAGSDFKAAIGRVRFAASTEESRWYLQGVHFDVSDDVLHFAATSGHVLAVYGVKAPPGAAGCPAITVPSEAVDAALTVFDGSPEIAFTVTDKAIGFAADGLRLSARLIDGKFPDYGRIIPARGQPALTFKRAEFSDCLTRASIVAGTGALMAIVARPEGDTLRLESRNHTGGEANEEVPATIADGFAAFGFNAKLAATFFANLGSTSISIEQSAPDAPHLVYSEDLPDFVGVLAPMKIAA